MGKGDLSKDAGAISWDLLPVPEQCSLNEGHFAFRSRNRLIMGGGSNKNGDYLLSSSIYNLDNKQWKRGPNLPFGFRYSGTTMDESSSVGIITGHYVENGKRQERLILFTEEEGFFMLKNFESVEHAYALIPLH